MLAKYAAPGIAFLVSVAFWPGISGAATSPRWAIAAVSLGFLDWWCLPFIAICFVALDFDPAVHWAILCGALCWGIKSSLNDNVKRETMQPLYERCASESLVLFGMSRSKHEGMAENASVDTATEIQRFGSKSSWRVSSEGKDCTPGMQVRVTTEPNASSRLPSTIIGRVDVPSLPFKTTCNSSIIASNETLDRSITFFAIGIGCSGGIAIAQWFGFTGIDQAVSPAGLFVNKNFMGEAAAIAFIAAASSRLWWSVVICLPALMMSSSRAAWLSILVSGILLVPSRWRIWLLLPVGMVFVGVWFGYLGTSETLEQRLFMWSDAIQRLTLFGNGTYDALFTFGRATELHNDWLQLIYELGLFGFIPLAVILAAGWNPQALPFVVALLVIGSFGFPLQMPATAWLAAFVVGHSLGSGAIERRMVLRARPSGDKPSTENGLFASSA